MNATPSIVSLATILLVLSTAAHAETRSIDVPEFSSASFDSALTVDVTAGATQSLTIMASHAEDLDDIRYEVVGGELSVWSERDFWDVLAQRGGVVKVTIATPSLKSLSATGASHVIARGLEGDALSFEASSASAIAIESVHARAIAVTATSAGNVSIVGECRAITAKIAGAASLDAHRLQCVDADITAASAGTAAVFASGAVKADVFSAGKLTLIGGPDHVDDEVDSGGQVEVLDE